MACKKEIQIDKKIDVSTLIREKGDFRDLKLIDNELYFFSELPCYNAKCLRKTFLLKGYISNKGLNKIKLLDTIEGIVVSVFDTANGIVFVIDKNNIYTLYRYSFIDKKVYKIFESKEYIINYFDGNYIENKNGLYKIITKDTIEEILKLSKGCTSLKGNNKRIYSLNFCNNKSVFRYINTDTKKSEIIFTSKKDLLGFYGIKNDSSFIFIERKLNKKFDVILYDREKFKVLKEFEGGVDDLYVNKNFISLIMFDKESIIGVSKKIMVSKDNGNVWEEVGLSFNLLIRPYSFYKDKQFVSYCGGEIDYYKW